MTKMPFVAQEIECAASFGWIGIVPVRSFFSYSGELFLKKPTLFLKTLPIVDVYSNSPQ